MKSFSLRPSLFCLFTFISFAAFAQNNLTRLGKNTVAEIVKAMTLEEKAALVAGTG
jgi:hypothetical protein